MRRLDEVLAPALEERRAANRYRRRRVVTPLGGARVRVEGREYLDFSSNDYLGLATDPRLAEAAARALEQYGTGGRAAHLITGHGPLHEDLEQRLAEFVGRERALLFSTGYMANIGLCQALVGRGDTVLEDRLNHASLLDGGLLSGARLARFAHADPQALEARLQGSRGRRLVLTDSVFSMDGDRAPLAELTRVCERNGAWLVADEAHAIGVRGPGGAGEVAAAGLDQEAVPVLMGTLGKALGCFGAFVAGSATLVETLIQQARSYVYTTAAPPALAGATLAALDLVAEEAWRREKLAELVAVFREGCESVGVELLPSDTAIQPIMVGDSRRALALSEALARSGYLVQAIRPPTVPCDTARLRVTLSAAHTVEEVRALADTIGRELRLAGRQQ